MYIEKKYGLVWRWNGSLTVNVSDGLHDVYAYTLGYRSPIAFQESIDEVYPFVLESMMYA